MAATPSSSGLERFGRSACSKKVAAIAGDVCTRPCILAPMQVAIDWSRVHPVKPERWQRSTMPLGAHWKNNEVHFAVYSRNATRIHLELFDSAVGSPARFTLVMQRCADHVFRAHLSGLPLGTLYGYRCWGPNWPYDSEWTPGNVRGFVSDVDNRGNRFNPNKLLIDPYARELSHDRETKELLKLGHHAEMYGSGPGLYTGYGHPPVLRRIFDTSMFAPKGVVICDQTPTGTKPKLPQKDTLIYEAHVRGLTKHPSASRLESILRGEPGFEAVKNVPPELRGTYLGAAYMAPYLHALGVTTLEFLPVHEAANDLNTEDSPEDRTELQAPHGNYWGYMTYGYFAPDRRYAFDRTAGGPTREFKEMVRVFHEWGIEIYLDVVFNHSGEGGLWEGEDTSTAEVLSFRGLDNASYYALTGEGNREYWVSTGCGNNLNCSNRAVRQLIVDSLTYWTTEMGVDGFRFDLATVLGREETFHYAFRGGAPLLTMIAELAERHEIEVVAEAWDTAVSSVGTFPKGWAEWNGRFRDVMRRFCRGDEGLVHQFAEVVNGDYHFFVDQGPHKSVNFIVAHDGFTLLDLVSYNQKHNIQAWPFGPSDGGSDDNISWDSGGSHDLRRQRLRNFLVLQMFSRGVPMIVGGDEYGRTQNGNNNPYKLDSVCTWQNYAAIETASATAIPTEGKGAYHDNFGTHASGHNGWFRFVCRVLALRKHHSALRQDKYGDFNPESGNDVTMLFTAPDASHDLRNRKAVQWRIYGRPIGDTNFALFVNMSHDIQKFVVPRDSHGPAWVRIIDTAAWAEPVDNHWLDRADATRFEPGEEYWVQPFSVAVFRLTQALRVGS